MDVIESAGGGYGPHGGGGYGPPHGGGGYGAPPGGQGPPGGHAPGGHGAPPWGAPPNPYGVPPPGGTGLAPTLGAPYGIEPVTGLPYSDKQKIVAGLLQLVLPGVGRLYAGHTGIGIAQLVSLLFCVGGIWGFIDAILILAGKVRDPEGRPLRD